MNQIITYFVHHRPCNCIALLSHDWMLIPGNYRKWGNVKMGRKCDQNVRWGRRQIIPGPLNARRVSSRQPAVSDTVAIPYHHTTNTPPRYAKLSPECGIGNAVMTGHLSNEKLENISPPPSGVCTLLLREGHREFIKIRYFKFEWLVVAPNHE